MALIVKLNGNNYVSDKTQGAFAHALQEAGGKKQEARSRKREAKDSGSASNNQQATISEAAMPSLQLLHRLDHALDQSYAHQTLTMRVHEQYLNNQSDYARIFSQLMQQQGAIFANSDTSPQQAAAATVLETLSRSMTRFHDLQEQTLDVHKQFLAQQSEYARTTMQLLKEQPIPEAQIASPKSQVTSRESADRKISEASVAAKSTQEAQQLNRHPAVSRQRPEPTHIAPPATALNTATLTHSLLAIVSDKTGYPADMLELDMDMEADLGIDSIKRVEILGALQEQNPTLPTVETDILAELRTLGQIMDYMQEAGGKKQEATLSDLPPATALDTATLTHSLLAIVSDKTGYPADMLELDMDMEADLGIDSIKRVEILGALQEQNPTLPTVETDILAELRTLGQIMDYMQEAGGKKQEATLSDLTSATSPPVSKKV